MKMGAVAVIFMLSCFVCHVGASSVPEATEDEVWDAWKAHVDKFHFGDSGFLANADRYRAFRETFEFVRDHNARYAEGKESYHVELNYRAAYLPSEWTRGVFQPALKSEHASHSIFMGDEELHSTSRKLANAAGTRCGPGLRRCPTGFCCGSSRICTNNRTQCASPNCQPAYGDCLHSTSTGLLPRPLGSQFSVPSVQEAAVFQYDSLASLKISVDWRPYLNPVQDQGTCGNCWAYSAAEAIESATAIAKGYKPRLSAQQLTDCSSGSSLGPGQGCVGGFPDLALNWVAQRGALGIATNASYPNAKRDQTCRGNGNTGATIVGFGYAPSTSELALKRALQVQPVIVNIKAGFSLQTYRGGILDDRNCGNEVDHSVLAVGYGMDRAANKSFWLVMNTWGTNWGERGFFRVAMSARPGEDYTEGICGLLINRPTYPIIKPPENPCELRPCGGGTCVKNDSAPGNYSCSACPSHFTVQLNPDRTQTCATNPCTAATNPCGVGSCFFSAARRFGYGCLCPNGTVLGSFADLSPTCTSGAQTYTVRRGDVVRPCEQNSYYNPCRRIAQTNRIAVELFVQLNPKIDCRQIRVGQVVIIGRNVPNPGCTRTVVTKRGDTCESIRMAAGMTLGEFVGLNPNLDCVNLPLGWKVCLSGNLVHGLTAPNCGGYELVRRRSRCNRIAARHGITVTTLLALNPGMNCPLRATRQVCIAPQRVFQAVRCGQFWPVQAGNTCWQIWTTYNLTESQFKSLNPGILCDFLEVGKPVCVKAFSS